MNDKLRVAIIEDEKPAARLLISMLADIRPEWSVEVVSGSVSGAVRWFEEHEEPDILFLDIQLNDGNSFLFLERISPSCPVIFTTAYDEYAIRAFSVNSIDYLLKPFDEKRLEEAVEKYEFVTSRHPEPDVLIDALKSINSKEKRYRTRFLINKGSKLEPLSVDDIAYFYSVNKITFAVSKSGGEDVVELALDKLADQLDPDCFFRANRQYIINVEAIKKIEPYFNGKISVTVIPKSNEMITVSKEKVAAFKRWLNY